MPFRDVPYAEDQALALDLLRAGYARAFVPDAAVVHSHDYGPVEQLRRHFDEFRALHDVHGHVADANPRRVLGHVRAQVRRDRAYGRALGLDARALDTGDAALVRLPRRPRRRGRARLARGRAARARARAPVARAPRTAGLR